MEYQAVAEAEEVMYNYECVRGYECENCGDTFAEIGKRVGYKFKKKCPSCKKMTLESLIMGDVIGFVKEITTVGQQADANNKKLGKYGVEDKIRQIKAERMAAQQALLEDSPVLDPDKCDIGQRGRAKTWYNPTGKDLSGLAGMTPEQKETYIMTGKKP